MTETDLPLVDEQPRAEQAPRRARGRVTSTAATVLLQLSAQQPSVVLMARIGGLAFYRDKPIEVHPDVAAEMLEQRDNRGRSYVERCEADAETS